MFSPTSGRCRAIIGGMAVGKDNLSNGLISGLSVGDSRGFNGRDDAVGVAYDLTALPFNDSHGY